MGVKGLGLQLTLNQDVVNWWKQYFKDHLNPSNKPLGEEAWGLGDGYSFLRGSNCQDGQKLLGGRAPGVTLICLELLKSINVVGLSRLP